MNKKSLTGWLYWAFIFLVVAIISALLGFGAIAGVSLVIAKWLAIVFLILFIISIIAHLLNRA